MNDWVMTAAGTVLIIAAVASCSSPPPNPPDALPVGTAQVMINGRDIGTTNAVNCERLGSLTIVTTGNNAAGTTSMLDSAGTVNAESVVIRDLSGFSGSYWVSLQGDAEVHVKGRTRLITGSAVGYNTDTPDARTTETFTIRVSC